MTEPANSTPAGPASGQSEGSKGDGPLRPHDDSFGPLDSPLNRAEQQENQASAAAEASTQQGK